MRLLGFFVLILALAAGAAFWLGWINFSTKGQPDDSKRGITVTVDQGKVKEDVNKAKEAVQRAEDRFKGDRSGSATVAGTISRVEPDQKQITVTTDKETIHLQVNDQTQIHVGDKPAHLTDLHSGEKATVAYTTKDKDHLAKSITVPAEE